MFNRLMLFVLRGIPKTEKKFLERIFSTYIENNPRVDHIMSIKSEDIYLPGLNIKRALPSDEAYREHRWWRMMLLRYGLAIYYSSGKNVLETCSGLGWGAYMVDGFANKVTCIELDNDSTYFSKRTWPTTNIKYVQDTVLKMPFEDESFEVALAMESIEHFNSKDQRLYIKEIYRVLKSGGLLIGSSVFPETEKEADDLCKRNPNHLHICTRSEIVAILKEIGFKSRKIFNNRLFFITKR